MSPERLSYRMPEMKKTRDDEVAFIKSQLYELYRDDKLSRKKTNWVNYLEWIKSNKLRHTMENVEKFKKTPKFVEEFSLKLFFIKLSHLQKDHKQDLYYMLSVAKDYKVRGFNVSGYIAGHFSKGVLKK